MKIKFFFICALCTLFFVSCGSKTVSYLDQPASDAYDKILKEEMENLPDFSAPAVLVKDLRIAGTPSDLKRYTYYPKALSSRALTKGGMFSRFL